MRELIICASIALTSCGIQHKASGTVKSEAEVKLDITSSVCMDERFTPKQKLECIKAITEYSVRVDASENLSDVIDSLDKAEGTVDESN